MYSDRQHPAWLFILKPLIATACIPREVCLPHQNPNSKISKYRHFCYTIVRFPLKFIFKCNCSIITSVDCFVINGCSSKLLYISPHTIIFSIHRITARLASTWHSPPHRRGDHDGRALPTILIFSQSYVFLKISRYKFKKITIARGIKK